MAAKHWIGKMWFLLVETIVANPQVQKGLPYSMEFMANVGIILTQLLTNLSLVDGLIDEAGIAEVEKYLNDPTTPQTLEEQCREALGASVPPLNTTPFVRYYNQLLYSMKEELGISVPELI